MEKNNEIIQKDRYIIIDDDNRFLVFFSGKSKKIIVPSFSANIGYDYRNQESSIILDNLNIYKEKINYFKSVERLDERFICINGKLRKVSFPVRRNYFYSKTSISDYCFYKLQEDLKQDKTLIKLLSYQEIIDILSHSNEYRIDKDLLPILEKLNDSLIKKQKNKCLIKKG